MHNYSKIERTFNCNICDKTHQLDDIGGHNCTGTKTIKKNHSEDKNEKTHTDENLLHADHAQEITQKEDPLSVKCVKK